MYQFSTLHKLCCYSTSWDMWSNLPGSLNFSGEESGHTCTCKANGHTYSSHLLHTHSIHCPLSFFFPELFLLSRRLELCKAQRNRPFCPSNSFWPSRMTALMRRMPFRSTMSTRESSNRGKSWSSLMNTRKRTGRCNGQLDWDHLISKKSIVLDLS